MTTDNAADKKPADDAWWWKVMVTVGMITKIQRKRLLTGRHA